MTRRLVLGGIRARTTLVATLVVGVALVLASAALISSTRSGLVASLKDAVAARTSTVAELARSGELPARLPGIGESLFAQVIDGSGRVIASSPSIEGQVPLVDVRLSPGQVLARDVPTLAEYGDSEDGATSVGAGWAMAAEGVQTTSGPVTVLSVVSLGSVTRTSDLLLPIIAWGAPALLLVVAATTWALTGLALRPVDAIRSDAEAISASALDHRLAVPSARDEIRDLAETMNRMLDRIEEAARRQRRFTSDASHELKSPIAAIRTMAEVALRDAYDEDVEALLQDVLAEDLRLESLVADLLLLARSDEAGLPLRVSSTDVAALLREEAAATSARGGIAPEVDVASGAAAEAVVDAERVRQLVRNLLDNAVRHARTGVWLAVRTDARQVVITVSDDGPGITPGERERVFERFVRLDGGRARAEGGTGLGLAVCRAIARAHGGDVRVVEPDHGGAMLEVRLPLDGHDRGARALE